MCGGAYCGSLPQSFFSLSSQTKATDHKATTMQMRHLFIRVSRRYGLCRARYCFTNLSVCLSVCPSVRHAVVLYQNECTHRRTLWIICYCFQPHRYYRIPRGTPSVWALNARGVWNILRLSVEIAVYFGSARTR